MATVPGPKPDRPVPRPGAPAEEPPYEPEEPEVAEPARRDKPEWLPEPYDPDREVVEPGVPIGL